MSFPYVEFLQAFVFRGDTFAIQQKDGSYKRVFRRPTLNDLRDHIEKKEKVLALYPSMNEKCHLGIIDVDIPHDDYEQDEAWEIHRREVVMLNDMLAAIGLSRCTIIESTGGRGTHIWVLSEEIHSGDMYHLLRQVCEAAGVKAEIFPMETPGLGKPIRLPLGTHEIYKGESCFIDPADWQPIPVTSKWLKFLDKNRMTRDKLAELGFDQNKSKYEPESYRKVKYSEIPKQSSFEDLLACLRPCFQGLYHDKVETTGGQGWAMMTAMGAELLSNGSTDAQVHQYFSVQKQYNKKTTNKHLRPIKKKNISPYRCKTLQDQCGLYILPYCEDCHIQKQDNLYQKIDEVVDKSVPKEEVEGGIEQTLNQFDCVALDLKGILDNKEHTILMNGYNTGKSWTTVSFLQRLLHEDGLRANFITPSSTVRDQMINRLTKANINFLDNPSNLALCKRAEEFQKLGYVPTVVCKKCKYYMPIQKLIKPVTNDYIDMSETGVAGTSDLYKELGNYYETCAKWVYLSMIEGTREENLVMLMTDAKVRYHTFIESSPLLPALASPMLYCNIVDQIDFINRKIPKYTVSDTVLFDSMKKLGILFPEEVVNAEGRLEEILETGDLSMETLEQIVALDYVKQFLHLYKLYDLGVLRKVYNKNTPETYSFDFQGQRHMRPVLNDVYAQKLNPRLYDNVIQYLSDLVVTSSDGVERVPKTFSEILADQSECNALLGLTATPTEIEVINNKWLASYRESQIGLLKNLYELPRGSSVLSNEPIDSRTIIYSRKQDNQEYINNHAVRGNTGLGGDKDEVIIESLQYPKNSEELIGDLIQIFGGNVGQGVKVFYQGIVSDAITQAHKYKADKIYVPDVDIFSALGFEVQRATEECLDAWYDQVKDRMIEKKGLYRHQLKKLPDQILAELIDNEYIGMKGKKYIALRDNE